jgi:transcriptional regulator with XRE-family HTH domain
MPRPRRTPGAAPCQLCEGNELGQWRREATRTLTGDFGFVYQVCETHYAAYWGGLRQAIRNRTKRTTAVPSLPTMGNPRRAWRDRPKHGPHATGDEQRRAREQAGWSLRRLARERSRSYSQLQSAESGRRPVDPEVAAWVRGVLDEPPSSQAERQIREALGDVLATKAEVAGLLDDVREAHRALGLPEPRGLDAMREALDGEEEAGEEAKP